MHTAEKEKSVSLTNAEKHLLLSSRVPKKCLGATFRSFDPEVYEAELAFIQDYTENFGKYKQDGIGLCLCGDHGIGKTRLISVLLKWFIKAKQKPLYYSLIDLVYQYENSTNSLLCDLYDADVLVIDDVTFDMEKPRNGSGWVLSDKTEKYQRARTLKCLEHLLRKRDANNQITIIITAMSTKQFYSAFTRGFVYLMDRIMITCQSLLKKEDVDKVAVKEETFTPPVDEDDESGSVIVKLQ